MIDQSAFVNVSIFDRNYTEALFGGVEFPDGSFMIDNVEEFIEHQKVFMEVVSQIRSENMFTFPVLTYSLLYKDDKFIDEGFARWCSDHNVDWNDSNFFISGDVTTLSNCCFDGSQKVEVIVDGEPRVLSLAELYILSESSHNFNYMVKSWSNDYDMGKIIKLPRRKLYKIELEDGSEIMATDNHLFPVFENTDDEFQYTGDKQVHDLSIYDCLIKHTDSGDILCRITSIEDYKSQDEYVYCFEMENTDKPYFVLANNIVTHNCRLLSDTSKLNAFINSIGGTALSIGSVKVNTINLQRIAYEAKGDQELYLKILRKRTKLCCKVLDVVRHIIKRNIEKGLLPNYCDGGVEMDKQYCTVGILGLFEVIEYFGLTYTDEFGYVYYTDEGIEFASKIFEVLNDVKDNFVSSILNSDGTPVEPYSFNIESVPAERAAVILCQKDNRLYEKNDKFIYSNQWVPLSAKCTIQEKLRLSSILDNKCSGGAIAHINLESNFPNTDTAWDMLKYIAKSGVIYFAFNTRINECKNHHGFVCTDICPVCGEPVFDTYQRIVGYLVPTRSYSKDRFKEFNTRRWYNYASELRDL